jgi:hypothetical protein
MSMEATASQNPPERLKYWMAIWASSMVPIIAATNTLRPVMVRL